MSPGFLFVTFIGIMLVMIYAMLRRPPLPSGSVKRATSIIFGLAIGFGALFMVTEALSSGSINSLARRHRSTVNSEAKDPVGFWFSVALVEFVGVAGVGGSLVMLFRSRP